MNESDKYFCPDRLLIESGRATETSTADELNKNPYGLSLPCICPFRTLIAPVHGCVSLSGVVRLFL
jgi:hypothetical protein